MQYQGVRVYFKNYKCFDEKLAGFDDIKNLNIIIGRNNSGKSSLLDIFKHLIQEDFSFPEASYHLKKHEPTIEIHRNLTQNVLETVFQKRRTSSDGILGNHWHYGKEYIGKLAKAEGVSSNNYQIISVQKPATIDANPNPHIEELYDTSHLRKLGAIFENPFAGKELARIHAERDIVPEPDTNTAIQNNGTGVTNIIQRYLNKVEKNSSVVDEDILNALNTIFEPEFTFKSIHCQQKDNGYWEIYLSEEGKTHIALSLSGSGLKTVIMVLTYIHILPKEKKKKLSEFIFCFEELENNLHPALLRRLINYLHHISIEHGCPIFITTHSNVLIDQYSACEDSQIIHVSSKNNVSSATTAKTYICNCNILDDLDIRASDILQSNGVIWVEGPSDRIYLNRWIAEHTNGQLQEGLHYQCIYYGGRILSHFDTSTENNELINILTFNRNAAILMDSDKKTSSTGLNSTKKRLKAGFEENSLMVWVTKGKEIENYLPPEAIAKHIGKTSVKQIETYEDFHESYAPTLSVTRKSYMTNKAKKSILAERLTPEINQTNMYTLDLEKQLNDLCQQIRQWNGIES